MSLCFSDDFIMIRRTLGNGFAMFFDLIQAGWGGGGRDEVVAGRRGLQ